MRLVSCASSTLLAAPTCSGRVSPRRRAIDCTQSPSMRSTQRASSPRRTHRYTVSSVARCNRSSSGRAASRGSRRRLTAAPRRKRRRPSRYEPSSRSTRSTARSRSSVASTSRRRSPVIPASLVAPRSPSAARASSSATASPSRSAVPVSPLARLPRVPDEGAAAGDPSHEAVGGEAVERRPRRHAADAELLAERRLGGKRRTGRQPGDTVTERPLDLVGERRPCGSAADGVG